MPSEQDPLLPQDKGAPEIHGSRAPSIYVNEHTLSGETADENGTQRQQTAGSGRSYKFELLSIVLYLALLIYFGHFLAGDRRPTPKTLEERVTRILSDTPLIDGHNDFPNLIRWRYHNHIYDPEFAVPFEQGGLEGHVDLPRLAEGKNGGAFWSVYAPCPANGTDFSDENYAATVQYTLSAIDIVARLQTAYPHRFSLPPNSSTAVSAFQSGLLISPLGVEGLHQIGNSLANLRNYYTLGVRYSTLTHNCHNKYADAALVQIDQVTTVAPPLWGGISPAGRELINEMNRLGMIVDLSHVSVNTMRDALGGSEDWAGSVAPVMFSHSSAYSVCPHPRNVPDDILQLVKRTNSVVMVNFAPSFISCIENSSSPTGVDYYPANNTIHQVVKHIMHIGDLIGYEHVGLGSDFDGIDSTPEGLEDVSKFPDLVGELLKQGVSDKEASMVVGGNILRVWAEVEKVAQKLQKDGVKPVEDDGLN